MSIRECRRLLARLAEDRFNLAILGQFSRGKSSLMNALLGSEKLPTGILPLTSVITTVAYGESEKVLLQREGWPFPQEIRLGELMEYVTQQGNPGNEKRVILAEVQLPNELLRLGVHFIDTPGVASAIAANTRTTRQFLPEADAAILVTSFESPMTESELKFLQDVREHVRKIFVVVNKLDLVSPTDRGPVLDAVRETLRGEFQDIDLDVFAVSARDALRAKQESSAEALALSGLPLLEVALTNFLRRDKARELLVQAAGRSANVAHQQGVAIRISERARSPREGALLEERLGERLSSLKRECKSIMRRLHNRLHLEFPRYCEEKIGLWNSEAETLLISEMRSWFAREEGEIGGPAFEEFLQRVSSRLFSEWLSRHRDELDRFFLDLTQGDHSAVEELASKVSAVPEDLLGVGHVVGPLPSHSLDAGTLGFRGIRVPVTNFRPPWWHDLLPGGRCRNFAVRRWLRKAPEFALIYQKAAVSLLEIAVDDWVAGLNRRLANRIESMGSHVSALLSQHAGFTDLAEVEQLLDRLQEFVKSVLDMGTEETASPAATAFSETRGTGRSASRRPCTICLRVERMVMDYLAHRQYELSVSESDQRQHALQSGFCPLHTWQYEAIASPQGVCAAYPQLLTLFAKRLRVLAQDSASVHSMEADMQSWLPKASRCPVCQLVAEAEKAAAHEIARQLAADEKPSATAVCAFHLRSVLAAGPSGRRRHVWSLKRHDRSRAWRKTCRITSLNTRRFVITCPRTRSGKPQSPGYRASSGVGVLSSPGGPNDVLLSKMLA